MIRRVETFTMAVLSLAMYCNTARGEAPLATLKVELQNVVYYLVDTPDISKFGTNPNITPNMRVGCFLLGITDVALGDIVAVNGHPAKGTWVDRGMGLCLTPTPSPSQSIADTMRDSIRYQTYEILQTDGTPVGTIMTNGLNLGGPSPPGPPVGTQNFAIVGGTGAFLGARGQTGNANQGLGSTQVSPRSASIIEDPANRRQNGGGHVVFTLYVIPMSRPEVVVTPGGPAVTHSNDFSLVSTNKPATAGEVLALFATGLGPTRPGLIPGQPFPSSPLAVVNSPVEVTVNGKDADVLGAIGYPGAVDGYQVNFHVPPDTAKGPAAIQVSAAWITGAPVSILVQ
jgi:uncharacterized protein (TIGR03437 family)